MKKEKYITPKLEELKINSRDIITTSDFESPVEPEEGEGDIF